MDHKEIYRHLTHAIEQVIKQGYVVEGELTFVQPKERGLIQCECVGIEGSDVGRLTVKIIKPTVNGKVPSKGGLVDGPPCTTCGNMFYIKSGTCLTCMNCGSTTGCS